MKWTPDRIRALRAHARLTQADLAADFFCKRPRRSTGTDKEKNQKPRQCACADDGEHWRDRSKITPQPSLSHPLR